MRFIFIALGLAGIILFVSTLSSPAYKDERAYEVAYSAIDPQAPDASAKFSELRRSELTNKYLFQNYGIVLLALGLVGFLIFRGNRVYSPKTKMRIALMGFLAVAATSAGLYISMFLGLSRGDYPHWADSVGIGIAENAFVSLVMCVFMLAHLIFLKGNFTPGRQISYRPSLKTLWPFLLTILSLSALIISVLQGDAFVVVGLSLWAYFFASLKAGLQEEASSKFAAE
jgi:hypothetical protein